MYITLSLTKTWQKIGDQTVEVHLPKKHRPQNLEILYWSLIKM